MKRGEVNLRINDNIERFLVLHTTNPPTYVLALVDFLKVMITYFRYVIADGRGNGIHWLQEDGEVLVQMHGHRSIIPFGVCIVNMSLRFCIPDGADWRYSHHMLRFC